MQSLDKASHKAGEKASSKVIVGMSGGVDSSVSARLLLDQGHQVEGLFMKNWDEDDGTEYCTAISDLEDASRVCDKLGIELHTANFAAEYWDNVFEYFLEEYRALRTPNPDVLCNSEIKFKVFLEYAEALGGDFIATGHYTRVKKADGGLAQLHKGLDRQKDQSYFLHAVSQSAFDKTLFPLGEIEKPEVRRIARENQFENSDKKDSTGICFIGERRFRDFLKTYIPAQPGDIETIDGIGVGKHEGLMYYTYGQRQGLGIGGVANHPDEPWYVVDKEVDRNVLRVAQGEHPSLFSASLSCDDFYLIDGQIPPEEEVLGCKTRYRQADQECNLSRLENGKWKISFAQPQRAVTPGQYAVIYRGDHCLGGGVINEVTKI